MEEFDGYFDEIKREKIISILLPYVADMRISRDVLMMDVPAGTRSFIPEFKNVSSQIRFDFDVLNKKEYLLRRGKPFVPISKWLRSGAACLKGVDPRSAELEAYAMQAEAHFSANGAELYAAYRQKLKMQLFEILLSYYMPFLDEHIRSGNGYAEGFAEGIESALKGQINYNKNLFIRNLCRKVIVRWEDEGHKNVVISDVSEFEFVPFAPEDIVWKTRRSSGGALQISGYRVTREVVVVAGSELDGVEEIDNSQHAITTTYHISASNALQPYGVHIERGLAWELDLDPTFEQVSPYVVQGCELTLANQAQDLRLIFHDVGGVDLFAPRSPCGHNWDVINCGDERSLIAAPVLLPGQGHMLVMSRLLGLDKRECCA